MNPNVLFISGIFSIPGFILIQSLFLKTALILFYFVLTLINKKKIKPLYFLILSTFITFFQLLRPSGAIVIEIGSLTITKGALLRGLLKAETLVGLIFISLGTIRKDLKLPGGAGIIFTKTFFYFEQFFQHRKKVNPRKFIKSIDTILFSLFPPDKTEFQETTVEIKETNMRFSIITAILIASVPWTVFIISQILKNPLP